MNSERKPFAKIDTMDGKTVRLPGDTWARVESQARLRGFEMLVFARKLIEYALSIAEDQTRMEASVGGLSRGLAGSQRTRRV